MMKKKIIFINSKLSSGGSERVMTLLANWFAEKEDYEVTMILIRPEEKAYEINKNIHLVQLKYNTNNKILKLIERIFLLRKKINEIKPDAIISFMIDVNIMTLIASGKRFIKKTIVSERADPNRNRNAIHRFFEKNFYKKCKYVVLQTSEVKRYFDARNILNTIIIPNPVNVDIKPYEGIRKNKIVAVGRLTEQKNFKLLIDAFKKINDINNNYQLEIFGEGPLKEKLKKQAQLLDIENKVIFHGFVNNVNEQMKDAKIYVSTSNYEGISNSMIEAMALGIPSICTNCPVGGAKMVIENRVNGLLIGMENQKELIDSIIEIMTNEELANKLSCNSIKIRDNFSIDAIGTQWMNIIEA